MHAPSSFSRGRRALIAGVSLLIVPFLPAQVSIEKPFTETLVASEQASSGLGKLSEAQRKELNRQITRELMLARQGDVKGFATSFTQRRTDAQQKSAGLDLLTTVERSALDSTIARTMALPSKPGTFARATAVDSIETTRIRREIHGEVSLTYGMGSGGRSFYGGSMAMSYEDPTSGVTTAIRIGQYRGDAWLMDGCDDWGRYGRFGRGYGYGSAFGCGR